MATLAITAAVQIGVGLLLNFVFAPKGPNVQQEGPRLNDTTVTSSAYGQPINIAFGTFRMAGNLIWSSGIEEVPNVSKQQGGGKGGGGGGSVTTTTYEYFSSFQIAFAEGVAENVLQMFADGKLILDRLNTTAHFSMSGLNFRFYPGDETQLPDALIEADKGVGNVPANRGLCHIVYERIPLVNFGNRIPNITAVITFNQNVSLPFQTYTLLSGAEIPGSVSGADTDSHMFLDFFSDQLYMFKDAVNGLSRSGVNDRFMKVAGGDGSGVGEEPLTFAIDNFIYGQFGSQNFQSISKVEPLTMTVVATFGFSGALGGDYPNGSWLGVKRIDFSQFGIDVVDILVISRSGVTSDGGIRLDQLDGSVATELITDLGVDIGRGGPVIVDFVSTRTFVIQENDTQIDLYEIKGNVTFGLLGSPSVEPSIVFLATYQKGGTDLPGTGDITAWCVLPEEEAVIISNESGMLKFNMDDGSILAKNLTQGFKSRNNVSTTGLFAFPESTGIQDCQFVTINTDTLVVVRTELLSSLVPGLIENTCYERAAYDYRNHSVIFSRVNGLTIPQDQIVRVFLNRASGLGVAVQDIVDNISTRVGIDINGGAVDFSSLSGLTNDGFVISNQTTGRQALEPLQQGHLFEIIESDFLVKSVNRGGSSVLTIPENDLGKLSTDTKEQFVTETRIKEVDLPLRLNVRYSEKAKDYQQNVQFSKRIGNVTPTTRSKVEQTIDLPMVLTATEAKQLSEKLLYTIWEERISLSSQLPWRYIRLDPTDIVVLTYQGELRTVRFIEIEIGADLSLEWRATQQDSRTNDSGVIGDGGSGFPTQLIPSALPTKFLPLDIPLLSEADASFQNFVRAYFAVAGFDVTQTFPGSILFNSRDSGSTFTEVAAAPLESSWGVVDGTIPNPITTTTWDTVTVITLKVARNITNFTSKTDLEVLNGANALAVIGSLGTEIIQFVNVTQIDAATVQISRLLRGRRGTEDISTGHGLAEQWVLMEFGKVFTFQIELGLRNITLPYRAVTLNTQLEDAQINLVKYTGQDLIPYSVGKITSSRDTTLGTLTINWVRRTRFGGELKDGTGEVPINETLEQYEIDFFSVNDPNTVLFTVIVNDTTSVTLTKTQIDANIAARANSRLVFNQIPVVNWEFESGGADSIPGWSGDISSGDGRNFFVRTQQDGPTSGEITAPAIGTFGTKWVGNDDNLSTTPTTLQINQQLNLLTLGYSESYLDSGETIGLDCQILVTDTGDSVEVFIDVLNEAMATIQTITTGKISSPNGWSNQTASAALAVGARHINVRCRTDKEGVGIFDEPDGGFDEIKVTLGANTIAPLDVRIYQMSGIVGRGRTTLTRV